MVTFCSRNHLSHFVSIGSKCFLAEYMFTMSHTQHSLLRMFVIGRCNVDCIHQRPRHHLFEGSKCIGNPMLFCKSKSGFFFTGTYGHQLEPTVLSCSGNHPVSNKIGTDYSKTNFICSCVHPYKEFSMLVF